MNDVGHVRDQLSLLRSCSVCPIWLAIARHASWYLVRVQFNCCHNKDLNTSSFNNLFWFLDVLETYALNPCTDVKQDISLEFEESYFWEDDLEGHKKEHSDDGITEYECTEDETSEVVPVIGKVDENEGVTQEYKEKAVAFWKGFSMTMKNKKKKRSIKSVQSKFKKLKSRNQLYRYYYVLEFPAKSIAVNVRVLFLLL